MARAPKKQTEVSLETIMDNCRNVLRGAVGGNEKNRDTVMGLVFLKFVGDKFDAQREKISAEYGDVDVFLEDASFYRSDNVFYLNPESRWSYIVQNASSDDITIIIDKAMQDIEDTNPPLKGALPQNFYSSLGIESRKIKNLIDEINKIDNSRFHDKDLIGRVQEYFLRVFAIGSGGESKGEFYTPNSIVELIAELIEPYSGRVYDPCCGTGGMFVQSVKFVESHHGNKKNISIFGQEENPDTWRLSKMNLALRGIAHNLGERPISTFSDDQHSSIKVDYIMANPPFNLKNWRNADALTDDPRFAGFSTPPVSNANYAWILHILDKLDESDGIAGFLLANGALNAGSDNPDTDVEYSIRKALIEKDKVEAIIVLPREMFYSTDISVTLWIINNNKGKSIRHQGTDNERAVRDRKGEVLFMDLRTFNQNMFEFKDKTSTKKFVQLLPEQIAQVREIYFNWQKGEGYHDIAELCQSVTKEEIAKQGYSLAPSKYIEFIDRDLNIDYEAEMVKIQAQMRDILAQEKASQSLLENAFKGIGYGI